MTFKMKLRKTIQRPQKLEDEATSGKAPKPPWEPTYPQLLESQIVPFNPHLPPAAFPSLPTPTDSNGEPDNETITKTAADDHESSDYDDGMIDPEEIHTGLHPKTRIVPALNSPLDPSFEDEMATSDDDDGKLQRDENSPGASRVRGVDNAHHNPQAITNDRVNWTDLCPSVQLAIIGQMSERDPMEKIYDRLGLYAPQLGDLKDLVGQYNYKSEMEDYLTFSLQQDQLRGILRVDHTSRWRGAPEAYQEFQTQNYMKKIRYEVDESLLQATRAEVNTGKRFLAQQSCEKEAIGYWEHVRGSIYKTGPRDLQTHTPARPGPDCGGLDSGYVSAAISPNRPPNGQERDNHHVAKVQLRDRSRQRKVLKGASKVGIVSTLKIQETPDLIQKQQIRSRNSTCHDSETPRPGGDPSTSGSNGRSRRSIRRTSKYDGAIAELKLKGSGGEGDSDYEMSDQDDEHVVSDKPHPPLPRLRITADNRIIGIPTIASTPPVNPENSTWRPQTTSDVLQVPLSGASRLSFTTPNRTASPLPAPRVLFGPPRTVPKPKQAITITEPSELPTMNKFNQNLLGMPREASKFTKSLLKASERDTPTSTPWIQSQPKHFAEPTLPLAPDQRRRSGTVNAPAFSPITERFQHSTNQGGTQGETAVKSSSECVVSQNRDLTTGEMEPKSSLPETPDSTSTPASEPYQLERNNRSIVTETGSPIPPWKDLNPLAPSPSRELLTSNLQNGATAGQIETATTLTPASRHPRSDSSSANVFRRLDPITGNIILDQPNQRDPTPTIPAIKPPRPLSSLTSFFPNQSPRPFPTLQAAGEEVKKAAASLHHLATSLTRTTTTTLPPTSKPANVLLSHDTTTASAPPPKRNRSRTPKAPAAKTPTSQAGGTGGGESREKRKYSKSEAQKQKELVRAEKVERERREKEERLKVRMEEK